MCASIFGPVVGCLIKWHALAQFELMISECGLYLCGNLLSSAYKKSSRCCGQL